MLHSFPMGKKSTLSLLAAGLAVLVAWLVLPGRSLALGATSVDPLADSDDDFLPDAVEWAVLTSAHNPDTDGDTIPDFVEVVQRGMPRHPNYPLALDQEMRLVMTASAVGGIETAWLHVLVRVVGSAPVSYFSCWLALPQVPGVQIPLHVLSMSGITVSDRMTAEDGHWLAVSVPLVSTQALRAMAPCSLHAEARIGGRSLHSCAALIDVQGYLSTIVPYDASRYAIQSLAPPLPGGGNLSNKVCLLDLKEVGSGPGGSVFQIVDAFCDDCNELECGAGCPLSVGWILTIPGGLQTVTGGG